MNPIKALVFTGLLTSLLGTVPAQATLIYSTNFDDPEYLATGVVLSTSGPGFTAPSTDGPFPASDGKVWDGNYLNGNGAGNSLTLSNLPAHTQVQIDMILGFLNSWDGLTGAYGPDLLLVFVDGVQIAEMTAGNASGTADDFDGGTVIAQYVQADGNQFYSDTLVDMATAPAFTLAHSASDLTLTITPAGTGWQGWDDEGWGMDDLRIRVSGAPPVPEPPLALLLVGAWALHRTREALKNSELPPYHRISDRESTA